MLVTELGIDTEVIFENWNALSPMILTVESITKFPEHPFSFVTEEAGISTEYVPPVQGKVTTSAFATLTEDAIKVPVNNSKVTILFISRFYLKERIRYRLKLLSLTWCSA
jgi:hypothetical protein